MDEFTRTAIKESIEHWKEEQAKTDPHQIHIAGENCPLCVAFFSLAREWNQCCGACPVFLDTGETECDETPYYKARSAWNLWKEDPDDSRLKQQWIDEAQKEIDYLESLLK